MTHPSLLRSIRLLLAVALLLPTIVFQVNAQTPAAEEQRLGNNTENGSMRFPQAPLAAAPLAPQTVANIHLPATKVLYQSYRDSNSDIFIANDDGTDVVRLTKNAASDIEPRLSRGGMKVVFASTRYNNQFDILTMNPDGSGLTRLTNAAKDDRDPVWSPDSTKILFQSKHDGNWEIYVMNGDGSAQTRLTNNLDDDITPNWSPDGSKIVWSSYQNGGYRIWVMNADGGGAVQLSQQAYSENPAWSPDGSRIAYDADSNGDGWQEIWLMNADGSNPGQIHLNNSNTTDFLVRGWSPNGSVISFTHISYVFYNNAWYWTNAYLKYTAYGWTDEWELGGGNMDFLPDWQTLDIVAPTSAVTNLPAESPSSFQVNWSGTDQGPAGIRDYAIQARDGLGGSWSDWIPTSAATSATFSGIGGHTYYFRSRAYDNCCNVEDWPSDFDAFTMVETLPPVSTINPLPPLSPTGLTVSWTGVDPGGSGIKSYQIQYKQDGGDWITWLYLNNYYTNTTSAVFPGESEHSFKFRVQAIDNAENVEDWPAGDVADAETSLASFGLTGRILNNDGNPVAGASVQSSLPPFKNDLSQVDGSYRTLVTTGDKSISVNWNKAGYGTLPQTNFSSLPYVAGLDVALPPGDNVVINSDMELSGPPNVPWSMGGSILPEVSYTNFHTGISSLRLGLNTGFSTPVIISSPSTGPNDYLTPQQAVEKNGTVHATWLKTVSGNGYVYYASRDPAANWSAPQIVAQGEDVANGGNLHIAFGTDGTAFIVWACYKQGNVFFMNAIRSPSGLWSNPVPVTAPGDINANYGINYSYMMVDSQGVVYLVWSQGYDNNYGHGYIFITLRGTNGNWSAPSEISQNHGIQTHMEQPSRIFIGADNSNTIYIFWIDAGDGCLYYRSRTAIGTWTDAKRVNNNDPLRGVFDAQIDSDGVIHIISLLAPTSGYYSQISYIRRNTDGSWSSPEPISITYSVDDFRIAVDQNGGIHIACYSQHGAPYGAPFGVAYTYKPKGGSWIGFQEIYPVQTQLYNLSLAVDPRGNPVVAWETGSKVLYTRKLAEEWTQPEQIEMPANVPSSANCSLGADGRGWIYMLWTSFSTNVAYFNAMLGSVESSGGRSDLAQAVTMTPTLTAPVLSFFYQLVNASPLNAAYLEVSITQGTNTTLLYSTSTNTTSWTQYWVDVSRWIGEQVTINFKLFLTGDQLPAYALIDDVSIGSTSPDLWVHAYTSNPALPGATITQTILYGNQGGAPASGITLTATLPDKLTFISADPAPASVNGQVLTWDAGDLAGRSGPFAIQVTASLADDAILLSTYDGTIQVQTTSAELETANNTVQSHLFVGTKIYLPRLAR